MPEWLDRLLVALAVGGALGYLVWSRWARRAKACGADAAACGCAPAARRPVSG